MQRKKLSIRHLVTHCLQIVHLTQQKTNLITNCSFDSTKNKFDCYKGKDCMERFCKDLRELAMKIINYE